ncbi:MAG: hypothetical protein FWF67_02135 [Fibromonadales bacterium]|nr:hypothetical protein [Fibromonadales bacterium]
MYVHRSVYLAKPSLAATLALAITLTFTQEAAAEKPLEKAAVGTFTDIRDKKNYKTVKIGSQVWMAENLNIDLLSSKCYDNKPDNCKKYGRLYDWKTAMKACPSDWYLPNEDDWGDLIQLVNPGCGGGGRGCGVCDCVDVGGKLKAADGWNGDGNGTDNYGFAALPGGVGLSGSKFRDAGNGGLWWSSSDSDDAKKASRISMDIGGPNVHKNSSDKNFLLSVRCLQRTSAQSFTDSRGKKNGKLLESTIDGGDGRILPMKLKYDSQNRIVEKYQYYYFNNITKQEVSTTTKITYGDNSITGEKFHYDGSKDGNPVKFVINGNTVTVNGKSSFTINKDGYIVGEYKYKDGNIIRYEFSDNVHNFKYDDKKSPFTNSNTPKWLFQYLYGHTSYAECASKNNVVEEAYNGEYIGNETTASKYEYDEDGFPIKKIEGLCVDDGCKEIINRTTTLFIYR